MYKLFFIGLIAVGLGLYFVGALDFDTSGSDIEISIDKGKASDLKDLVKESVSE